MCVPSTVLSIDHKINFQTDWPKTYRQHIWEKFFKKKLLFRPGIRKPSGEQSSPSFVMTSSLLICLCFSNPTPLKEPLLQNVTWPTVDPRQPDSLQYLNINETLEVRTNPRYYQRVRKVLDYYVTYKNINWSKLKILSK